MSTSSGGGPETLNTLTKEQKKLSKLFASIVGGELQSPSRVDSPLFSKEQEKTFDALIKELKRTGTKFDQVGVQEALGRLLRPTSKVEVLDPEDVTADFTKSVANPLIKTLTERLLPQIRRGFQGFSSRSGGATLKAIDDLGQTLAAKLAQAQSAARLFNANLILQAEGQAQNARIAGINLAPGVLGAEAGALGTQLQLQEAKQGKIRADEGANLPINNPALQLALSFVGQSHTQVVDRPAEQTAFGTALSGAGALDASGFSGGFTSAFSAATA